MNITHSLLLVAPILSFLLTGVVRRYALSSQLIDFPNKRSSHTEPVPRGGGLSIVVVAAAYLLVFGVIGKWPATSVIAFSVSGVAVALTGWVDDHRNLRPRFRLLIHLSSASLLVIAVGALPGIPFPGTTLSVGWVGSFLAALSITWFLNLYNFMDGIDGLAGIEAVTVGGGGWLILWWIGEPSWAYAFLAVSLASLGFLVWNWPPAKVFMGDAGSGYLGFVFGGLFLLAWVNTNVSPWVWLILFGIFIVDASVTLLRRLLRGQRVHEAHRSHAYQHAALKFGSHLPVTAAIGFINVAWLLPLGFTAAMYPELGAIILAVAWIPVILLALWFGAGKESS